MLSTTNVPVTSVSFTTVASATSSPSVTDASVTTVSLITNASAISVPSATIAFVQTTESSGVEIERADVPAGTTGATEGTI